MADKMTREQRRRCMQHVHSKDTKPEWIVRRWLWAQGFRYRLHVRRLPGTPDIVMRRYHTVINVNGCFWHGHEGCSFYSMPKSNTKFWKDKIARNRQRDTENAAKLKHMGWYTITIWECDLTKDKRTKTLMQLSCILSEILLKINGVKPYSEMEEQDTALAAEPAQSYVKKKKQ